MNKRFALIALLLAALMLLSGCNLIGHDDELDGAQVVAKVETSQDTTEITKAEWEAYRDYLASYYQQYFQQNFGVSMQVICGSASMPSSRDNLQASKLESILARPIGQSAIVIASAPACSS